MRPTRRRIPAVSTAFGALTAVAAAAVLPALAADPASAASPRVVVGDTHPSWAVGSAQVAKAPTAKRVTTRVYLSSRNEAGLDAAVTAVSTPGSPSYRHFLTPAQYRAEFGPAPSAATKVTGWLRAAGLQVSAPRDYGRYVEATGTVSAAERAFGTTLSLYRHAGGSYQAPAGSVTIPVDVSPYVLTVAGLDESPARVAPSRTTDAVPQHAPNPAATRAASAKVAPSDYTPGFRSPHPCSAYYGQYKAAFKANHIGALPKFRNQVLPYVVCGYRPNQLRTAYGAPASLTGQGVTVAIIDAYFSGTLVADANRYALNSGGQPFSGSQFSALVPAGGYTDQALCDDIGWYGEQALDLEAVHGFAPGANVLYTAGRSCNGLDLFDAEIATVEDNRASIISLSYGDTEDTETAGTAAAQTALFKQAALQGIGFYVASGDNGDNVVTNFLKQPNTPASNPYVTAVGGTSLAIGPAAQYWFEAGWGTHNYALSANSKRWILPAFWGGSGGGFSTVYARPSYQNGVVYPGSPPGRAVPDVAMDADPNTGMIVGQTQWFPDGVYYDEYRAGGTSLSAPLFAAVQALTSQAQHARLGFANPRIYALAKQALAAGTAAGGTAKAFRDVTPAHDWIANVRADYADAVSRQSGLVYSVRTFGDDTSLATRKGWDTVTGVGTPSAAYYTATG